MRHTPVADTRGRELVGFGFGESEQKKQAKEIAHVSQPGRSVCRQPIKRGPGWAAPLHQGVTPRECRVITQRGFSTTSRTYGEERGIPSVDSGVLYLVTAAAAAAAPTAST